MELLVVMGIFSLTVGVTSAIFLQSNQAQRRVLASTAAQSDLRFALEALVREVRSGTVDYAFYEASAGGVSVPVRRLVIKNASGRREEFYLEESPAVCPVGTAKCLAISLDGGAPQSVTSAGVVIDTLLFYVSPTVDPFTPDPATGAYKADQQPTVTIAMRARTTNPKPEDVVIINAQTTVTARTYAR